MVENFDGVEWQVVNVQMRLLPCPFCGASAKICVVGENVDGLGSNAYAGVCPCCCSVGKPFLNAHDAAEFWNTRDYDFPF